MVVEGALGDAGLGDERHLAAAADWIIAGIPQMSPAAVTEPIELVLTGPAGRTAHFGPDGDPVATVTSSIPDLVLWSTGRRSWREIDVGVEGISRAGSATPSTSSNQHGDGEGPPNLRLGGEQE